MSRKCHTDLLGRPNLNPTLEYSGAAFDDANMSGWRVHDANLSGLRITKANLAGASVADCRLDGMTIDGILVTELLAAYRAAASAQKA